MTKLEWVLSWIIVVLMVAIIDFWPHRACARDLAIGDSIALGTGHALGVETRARSGVSSCWVKNIAPSGSYDHVVISVGINDAPGMCAGPLRWLIHARQVVWILPAPINSARDHIAMVAASFGDYAISYQCRGGCSKRNFHPASYEVVAQWVRSAWNQRQPRRARSAKSRASSAR